MLCLSLSLYLQVNFLCLLDALLLVTYKVTDPLMRLAMELEFDKYCQVDASPTTVLPSPRRRRSKVEKKKSEGNPKIGDDMLNLDVVGNFTEIRFHHYRSASCKNIPSSISCLESNATLKRGSAYQSSKEIRQMKKIDNVEERRKIEISRRDATALSFGIVDSLCSSDEDSSFSEQSRSSLLSLNSDLSTRRINNPHVEISSCGFVNLSPHPDSETSLDSYNIIQNQRPPKIERRAFQHKKIDSAAIGGGGLNQGNGIRGRDSYVMLNKSLSAKLALPHSPAHSESDSSRVSSPKDRFTPIRKMFDPFVKSKSYRNSLNSAVESGGEIPNCVIGCSQNRAFRKSLLRDFSSTAQNSECDSRPVKDENQDSPVQRSPAQLHALLKLVNKDGVPFFEFAVESPADTLVAKTWKVNDSSTWIYTFHSLQNKRKSNASGRGSRFSNRESSMVGQMQVSCHLCKELKKSGLDKSMVTEFVLYDISRLRKSVLCEDSSTSSPDVAKPSFISDLNPSSSELDEVSATTKTSSHLEHGHSGGQFDPSISHPVAADELHPDLESAAIVIQVPFEKRESLKFKSGDTKIDQQFPNLLDFSIGEQRKEEKVNVVIPSGNHGMPTPESHGPTPLLDRWRLGGGCDCGGWDMACPLHVFNNSNILVTKDHSPLENQLPFKLFVQGKKDNAPALTIMVTEDKHYAIDFHAQLSALQAFSICISVLHTVEASSVVGKEKRQSLQCDSLRVFVEEKIKNLIDAIMEEEKCKVNEKMEEVLPSFKVNPPFSPIARV